MTDIISLSGLSERKGGGFQTGYEVYSAEGVCPTLLSHGGGYGILTVIEVEDERETDRKTDESANRVYDKEGLCPTIPTCAGGGIQPKVIDVKQNFVSDGNGGIATDCSPEIMPETKQKTIEVRYRIRKLTPRECGRLMGVDDNDITKMLAVNSNSQCYKQFGNSIVVDCLCALFRQLNIKGVKPWNKEIQR